MLALVVSARNSDCPTQGEFNRRSSRDPSGSEGGLAVPIPVGEISVKLRMRVPCSKMARATNSPVNDKATTSGGLLLHTLVEILLKLPTVVCHNAGKRF